jgi:polysaccharide export outer membrane protein
MKKTRSVNMMASFAATTILLAGCAAAPNPNALSTAPPTPKSNLVNAEYRIGVDDVLRVSTWQTPDLSVDSVPVSPDGTISLPLIGNVEVNGMTNTEAAKVIEQRIARYVKDPKVTVTVTQPKNQEYQSSIRVTGAVKTPTSAVYHQGMHIVDAISKSGGPNDVSVPNSTTLHRKIGTEDMVYTVHLEDVMNGTDMATNYDVYPGDIITVPEKMVPITTTTPVITFIEWLLILRP